MERKLKITDIAHFLPYGLTGYFNGSKHIDIVSEYDYANNLITGLNSGTCEVEYFKPILRPPMSIFIDLEINENLKKKFNKDVSLTFELIDNSVFIYVVDKLRQIQKTPVSFYAELAKQKIDTTGLIAYGLAVESKD